MEYSRQAEVYIRFSNMQQNCNSKLKISFKIFIYSRDIAATIPVQQLMSIYPFHQDYKWFCIQSCSPLSLVANHGLKV